MGGQMQFMLPPLHGTHSTIKIVRTTETPAQETTLKDETFIAAKTKAKT
jgi:hypothetical protein